MRAVKIASLFRSPNGTQEPFQWEFSSEDFQIPEIQGPIEVAGQLLRVQEGIMMLVQKLEATQSTVCSRCGKKIKCALSFKPSEWLFYEKTALMEDTENEDLQIDLHRLEIHPLEPIRQDLLLNLNLAPRCPKPCRELSEKTYKSKPLFALKTLYQEKGTKKKKLRK